MTGLPIILRGLSFRSESQIARLTIFHSQTAFDFFAINNFQLLALGFDQQRPTAGCHSSDILFNHQRRAATPAQTASTRPNGHAPCRNP
jgi:hypothetical protein